MQIHIDKMKNTCRRVLHTMSCLAGNMLIKEYLYIINYAAVGYGLIVFGSVACTSIKGWTES